MKKTKLPKKIEVKSSIAGPAAPGTANKVRQATKGKIGMEAFRAAREFLQ